MASKAQRDAAIEDAAKQVREGSVWLRRAGDVPPREEVSFERVAEGMLMFCRECGAVVEAGHSATRHKDWHSQRTPDPGRGPDPEPAETRCSRCGAFYEGSRCISCGTAGPVPVGETREETGVVFCDRCAAMTDVGGDGWVTSGAEDLCPTCAAVAVPGVPETREEVQDGDAS